MTDPSLQTRCPNIDRLFHPSMFTSPALSLSCHLFLCNCPTLPSRSIEPSLPIPPSITHQHLPIPRPNSLTFRICPFATNLQFQVLTCSSTRYIRLILNDAVVPLTGLNGCEENEDGLCELNRFVDALKEIVAEVDFGAVCG
jgi:hypothetical protein